MQKKSALRQVISELSQLHGFDAVGFAPASRLDEDADFLKDWLSDGRHAEMGFMQNHFDKRVDVSLLVPGAKSVVVFLKNYFPEPLEHVSDYRVAKYAYGRDYHKVIRKKLQKILADLVESHGLEGRVFVDSAPLLERALAKNAGLGFIGKNTMLINKKIGSFCFISEIVLNVDLGESDEVIDACGSCRKCIDACPTGAILGPRLLDSGKCISYLSIEKKTALADDDKQALQQDKFVFGCDICQDVCPWNSKILPGTEADFKPRNGIVVWDNHAWESMDQDQFFNTFAGTPLMRAGFYKMKRNVEALNSKK